MTSPDTMTSSDTRPDTGSRDAAETAAPSTGNRMIRILAAMFGIVLIVGAFVGFFESRAAAGNPPIKPAAMAIMLLFGALGACALWQLISNLVGIARSSESIPTRERTSNRLMMASLAIGGGIGAGYVAMQRFAPHLLYATDGRLLVPTAIAAALLWGVAMPALTRWWLNRIDEHERQAYVEGAYWAAHALLFGVPVWLILWKAGLTDEPQLTDCAMMAVLLWALISFRRKFV